MKHYVLLYEMLYIKRISNVYITKKNTYLINYTYIQFDKA